MAIPNSWGPTTHAEQAKKDARWVRGYGVGDRVNVGDRIKMEVNALWATRRTVWRTVKTIDPITVRLGGWPDYYVKDHEILGITPRS
jgi:hypothetical protein